MSREIVQPLTLSLRPISASASSPRSRRRALLVRREIRSAAELDAARLRTDPIETALARRFAKNPLLFGFQFDRRPITCFSKIPPRTNIGVRDGIFQDSEGALLDQCA